MHLDIYLALRLEQGKGAPALLREWPQLKTAAEFRCVNLARLVGSVAKGFVALGR